MMKNRTLNNTANEPKSASMSSLATEQFINSNDSVMNLIPREGLYNKSINQLCELLKISKKEYKHYAFSKEQLVEFLLTPKD